MRRIYLLILCSMVLLPTGFAANPLPSLLPDTLLNEKLTAIEGPQIYTGEELFTLIDGGAEIYFEYGFEAALNVAYQIELTRFDLQLYQMADAAAALGIFTHSKQKGENIQYLNPGLQFLKEGYLMFCKGSYFGVLAWSDITEFNAALAQRLAGNIMSRINGNNPYPDLVQKALQAGFSLDSMRYIRGTLALSACHFFSHKNIFEISEALCIEKDPVKYLVFAYTDEEKSVQVFGKVKNELSGTSGITNFSEEPQQFSYTDRRNRKIVVSRSRDKIIAAIFTNASDSWYPPVPEGME